MIDCLLRPEEEDGGSGELEVVIPLAEGKQEMGALTVGKQPGVAHEQGKRLLGLGTGCLDDGVTLQRSRDAE